MISKEKLLKGMDEYIENLYYCMVDDDLDNIVTKEQIEEDRIRIEKLNDINKELKKLL